MCWSAPKVPVDRYSNRAYSHFVTASIMPYANKFRFVPLYALGVRHQVDQGGGEVVRALDVRRVPDPGIRDLGGDAAGHPVAVEHGPGLAHHRLRRAGFGP